MENLVVWFEGIDNMARSGNEIDTNKITNKLVDGESLLDESIFFTKGMQQGMVIRNPVFKDIFYRCGAG